MLKVRLQRTGRRNDPSFRIVVTDSRKGPKTGAAVEQVGFYNPRTKERSINVERVRHWIANGAQVSDTVHNMLVSEGVIEGAKKNVLPQKSPVIKEQAETTEPAAAEAPDEASNSSQPTATEANTAPESEPVGEEAAEETAASSEEPAEERAAEEGGGEEGGKKEGQTE